MFEPRENGKEYGRALARLHLRERVFYEAENVTCSCHLEHSQKVRLHCMLGSCIIGFCIPWGSTSKMRITHRSCTMVLSIPVTGHRIVLVLPLPLSLQSTIFRPGMAPSHQADLKQPTLARRSAISRAIRGCTILVDVQKGLKTGSPTQRHSCSGVLERHKLRDRALLSRCQHGIGGDCYYDWTDVATMLVGDNIPDVISRLPFVPPLWALHRVFIECCAFALIIIIPPITSEPTFALPTVPVDVVLLNGDLIFSPHAILLLMYRKGAWCLARS